MQGWSHSKVQIAVKLVVPVLTVAAAILRTACTCCVKVHQLCIKRVKLSLLVNAESACHAASDCCELAVGAGDEGCGKLHSQHHWAHCHHGQEAQAGDGQQAAAAMAALGDDQL